MTTRGAQADGSCPSQVFFKPGTALLYRADTWHRAGEIERLDFLDAVRLTSLCAGPAVRPGKQRLTQQFMVRRADAEWCTAWHRGWARAFYDPQWTVERMLARATVQQRTFLGFPEPASPYWTAETLAAVTHRYEELGFDPAPYARALAGARL